MKKTFNKFLNFNLFNTKKLGTNVVTATLSLLVLSAFLLNSTPLYADEVDPEALEEISSKLDKIEAKEKNQFNARISVYTVASEYVFALSETINLIKESFEEKYNADEMPGIYRKKISDALKLFLSGRGRNDNGEGWSFQGVNADMTVNMLNSLLDLSILDADMQADLLDFLSEENLESEQFRKNAGFPPQWEIHSPESIASLKNLIQKAPLVQYIHEEPKVQQAHPVEALHREEAAIVFDGAEAPEKQIPNDLAYEEHETSLIKIIDHAEARNEKLALSPEERTLFFEGLEDIYFDDSMATLRDPEKSFVNYFGRDREQGLFIDAIGKLDKAHVLLTGKAGVGKTTLIKMLQDAFVLQEAGIRDEEAPIMIQLPITDITNTTDPTRLKSRIALAAKISRLTGRRLILFVDEAHVSSTINRNAIKGFLSESIVGSDENSAKVHLAYATTSDEARTFLEDSAFSRRWSEVYVPEFSKEDTKQLILQALVPLWKKQHQRKGNGFAGLTEEALEFGVKYGKFEQAHAGRPTGPKELLEAAVVYKLNRMPEAQGEFVLKVEDIRKYLREQKNYELMPGDPDFEETFEKIWQERFVSKYAGQHALKFQLKQYLKSYFQNLEPEKMLAMPVFGPPGAGKSYLAEVLADAFFEGNLLTVNAAEYVEGGLGLNKLIGSPTGTVGSEEQRSPLTKALADNPRLVLVVEEADYMHGDLLKFFVNMITDKEFADGLGRNWDTSQVLILLNSNVGQQLLIPANLKNAMTWREYNSRRKALIHGKGEDERYNQAKIDIVFEEFVRKIVKGSAPDESAVMQESAKMRRRFKPFYAPTPNKAELEEATQIHLRNFLDAAKADYGVEFRISQDSIDAIVDLEKYEFEKGFSYVQEKLEDVLFGTLRDYFHKKGETFDVTVEIVEGKVEDNAQTDHFLVLHDLNGDEVVRKKLNEFYRVRSNPWAEDAEMLRRIEKLPELMDPDLIGNEEAKLFVQAALKNKLIDWDEPLVLTLLGPTGNGKTEFAKVLARVLYGKQGEPYFKIPNLSHEWELNEYIRPSKGIVGANETTEFEEWVESRIHSGGGLILFDELLSIDGLSRDQISHKVAVINKLYDLLDEGKLRIGHRTVDMRAFPIVITGNALQNLFANLPDDPSAEALIKKISKNVTDSDITKYFTERGIDAPKVARFGKIKVLGPLSSEESLAVAKKEWRNFEEKVRASQPNLAEIDIDIDENIFEAIILKMKTHRLGMRNVSKKGLKRVLKDPLTNFIFEFTKSQKKIESIEAKLSDNQEAVIWKIKTAKETLEEESGVLATIEEEEKLIVSDSALKDVAIHEYKGHWMVGVLLERENTFQAISLYPGENYLGYVRHKDSNEMKEKSNLTALLKKALVLNAGYRSVIHLTDSRSTGGGNALRNQKRPTDDFGKIQKLFEQMFFNRMLENFSENTDPKVQTLVKEWLWSLIDTMVEKIIDSGQNIEAFGKGYEKLLKEKYLGEEDLDSIVEEVNFKALLGSREQHLFETLASSVEELLTLDKEDARAHARASLGIAGADAKDSAAQSLEVYKKIFYYQFLQSIGAELSATLVDKNQAGEAEKLKKAQSTLFETLNFGNQVNEELILGFDLNQELQPLPALCQYGLGG